MSVYRLAMGAGFARLQPELQDYFDLDPAGPLACGTGTGTFDVAGCPLPALRPLLRLSARDRSLFPEYQRNVPFTIVNRAGLDAAGRPALSAVRTLEFAGRTRIMEDVTVWDPQRGVLLDRVGRSGLLSTDLECSAGADGRMRLVSRRSRLLAGPLSLPLPRLLEAAAFTEQWWDQAEGRFRIRTKVIQRQLGTVLEYDGAFSYRPGSP
ncbi:DUF4166 domain-containing protein [Arthrobacter sp. I2-34]|uniref:DUF4166 domain-containing protein n=1 Tax=Arthrobacter hankyongi TaxID=2904801 RepID=A0ABS9L899_9MICC|nr:DUF4166 domain-containing protein [Arthrobacter hankyongi]MCG2622743.1 DUF4166 domain-containing protein [Arthrobacter hankyongi]